jgi:hypothetical protein
MMIGFLELKMAPFTISSKQGKTALVPSSVFLSSLHFFTYSSKESNK